MPKRTLRSMTFAVVGAGMLAGAAIAPAEAGVAAAPAAAASAAGVHAPVTAGRHVRRSRRLPWGAAGRLSGTAGLMTSVGYYRDCTGQTRLTTTQAQIDTCITGRTYFVGHNRGVFTPLMHMHTGQVITYTDGAHHLHRLRIVSVRDGWPSANGAPPVVASNVVAQFQTCESYSPSGQFDRIIDVVNA